MFKVLIAEDEPPIMRMIKSTLETVDSDFKVTECCINGKNAVEKLKNEDFDIVTVRGLGYKGTMKHG